MRAILSIIPLMAVSLSSAAIANTYDDCLTLVETDPVAAERSAGDWVRYGGGGGAARHCYALALLALGASDRAIEELIGAATEEPGLTDSARSDMLVQAGELLVEDEDLLTAAVVAEQALRLTPRGAGALGLRGTVKIANGELRAGIRDLDQALAENGAQARWLLRRAAAHRQSGAMVAARDDASFAAELAPDDPSVWLEFGRAQAGLGDKRAARQSLLRAIELDRAGKIGRAAQLALQRMEVGVE